MGVDTHGRSDGAKTREFEIALRHDQNGGGSGKMAEINRGGEGATSGGCKRNYGGFAADTGRSFRFCCWGTLFLQI